MGTFGLSAPVRRAAAPIPANIAEGPSGPATRTMRDSRFRNVAEGSIAECRPCLTLARDLGYGKTAVPHERRVEEAARVLARLDPFDRHPRPRRDTF